jgi:hypothetical protein
METCSLLKKLDTLIARAIIETTDIENIFLFGELSCTREEGLMTTPKVESYAFGEMVVDGQTYTNDLIVLPERVVSNWWRDQGHRLSKNDLSEVFEAQPEVLVVGTGAHGVMKVPKKTRQAVREAGIELRVVETGDAWRTYNSLREERETAGAFHLTC